MPTSITLGAVLQGVGAVTSLVGFMDQQSAKDDQRAAREQEAAAQRARQAAEQRAAEQKNIAARRAAVREARIKQATIVNSGATNAPGSSSVVAGAGAVGTQLGYNLGQFTQGEGINSDIYAANARIGDASIAGAIAGANYQQAGVISSLGKSAFELGGGFKSVFGGAGGSSGNSGTGSTMVFDDPMANVG
jgi:hypothetical protein